MTNDSLMKVESIAEKNAPLGAFFCNAFDLHYAIIGPENQVLIFLRVAVLCKFYCMYKYLKRSFNKLSNLNAT